MTAPARHLLAPVKGGGLLLDLESGAVFTLNRSAALIWSAHLDGASNVDIAATLSREFGLSPAVGIGQVEGTLSLDRHERAVEEAVGEFRYERTATGYSFARGDEVLVTVDDRGEVLELAPAGGGDETSVAGILQAIVPKLIALRGQLVLHASAVLAADGLIAFSGVSEAGKTTSARALAAAGATLACEDKLVVRERDGRPEGLLGGEDAMRAWTEWATGELAARGRAPCDRLDAACAGPSAPIREIGFIAAARRQGGAIAAVALTEVETAAAVFGNSFYGADVPEQWARRLQSAAELAGIVRGYELTMPATLGQLDDAAAEVVRRGSFRSA